MRAAERRRVQVGEVGEFRVWRRELQEQGRREQKLASQRGEER